MSYVKTTEFLRRFLDRALAESLQGKAVISGGGVIAGLPQCGDNRALLGLMLLQMEDLAAGRYVPGVTPETRLRMLYLVAPCAPSHELDLILLDSAASAFRQNPIMVVDDDPRRPIQVVPRPLSLSEGAMLWQSLAKPFRPALLYEVTVSVPAKMRQETPAVSAGA